MDTNLPTTAQAPMIALIKTKNIMNDNNLKTKTKRAAALLLLLALLAPWAARAQSPDCNEPIAVTPNAPYIEDFESPEGVPSNWAVGPVPDCWGQYTTGPALPHITNDGGALEGAQYLSFYQQGDSYAILPKFSTAINLLKISFWERRGDGLQLGYITADDNGTCNTFTAIETYYGGGSVWTQHVTYLSDVPETAHRLAFKWIGGGSNCIDYVEVTFFDGCYNVGTLSTSDLTAHSVHLSWDLIDDSQTEWNVQVANNADFTENLVEYLADSHEDYLIDNLDGGTVYYVRVGPTCSEYWWSNTVAFATQCDDPITVTADAPYTQGFEDGWIPGCWDVYAEEGNDAPSVNNDYLSQHSGSYSLRFEEDGYAVLPKFSNPLDELQISFWIKYGPHGQLQLGYITAEDDGTCNTFTAIADYSALDERVWVQYTNYLLNVPATAHRLAFKVISNFGLFLDDVEVSVIPLGFCYPVGNLGLGRVASNSAYLSWEVYDAEQNEWDVQVATDANFTENVANHVANSHENYLLEGLDPDTYYYVRVKPRCSDDFWSNMVQFWTMPSCNGPITVTADAPYTEGFENPEGTYYSELGRLPACWESYTTGTVGPHNTTAGSANVHGGSQSLSFISDYTSYAILPEFSNPLNELQISFWLKRGNGQLQLGYLTAEDEGNCNTFTAVADFEGSFNAWTQHTAYLLNVPEAAHRLAFKFSESAMNCFIDDLEVSICTIDCFPVDALSVDSLSSTSAYLSWELIDNSQTAWNVQLATDAAFTNILADEETDSHENYLLEGLSIGTYYYVRVKPTCTDDLWKDLEFALPCAPITVTTEAPYTQGFETPEGTTYDASGPLPLCWETYMAGMGVRPHNSSGWSHGGTQSLVFNNQGSTFAVLPEFSNPLNQLQVSFWMKTYNNNGTLQLGYLTAEDDDNGSSFTSIVTYNNNYGNQIQHSTVLENVPAEAERLAFKWSATNMLYCYIDDLEVSINLTLKPTNLTCTEVTGTSATLTWTSNAESWQIMLNDDETNLIMADTNPFTLTGLVPETFYTAKVRSYWDSDNQTEWSDPVSFSTNGICPEGMVCIGNGTQTNNNLPTSNYYKYGLTQQIYTADEIGQAGSITSIEFFKASAYTMSRDLDIYLVCTDKEEFENTSDWIPVTANDLVFSGTVTFADQDWTAITLDEPFNYYGTSNVAVVVDDNTGGFSYSLPFHVFSTEKEQTILYCDSNNNYDPTASPGNAINTISEKNRIRLGMEELPDCERPTLLAVDTLGATSATLSWTENGEATSWQIMLNDDHTNLIEADSNPFTLDSLIPETTYTAKVRAHCPDGNGISLWSSPISFNPTRAFTIGAGTATNNDLPTNNFYKYSYTQQIYTTEELGEAGLIERIDFFKNSTAACNRNLDIYLVSTDKSSFDGGNDWIVTTEEDLVFSGTVNFVDKAWTIITFDKPFIYNGLHNVAIIVDDHTGSYVSRTPFLVFDAPNQALSTYHDKGEKAVLGQKNQIRVLKSAMGDCINPTMLAASELNYYDATLTWEENGTSTEWVVDYWYLNSSNEEVHNQLTVADSTHCHIENLSDNTEYHAKVRPVCDENKWSNTAAFTTLEACSVPVITLGTVTATTAEFSWTGLSEGYTVMYRESIVRVAGEWQTLSVDEAAVILNNLVPEADYEVKVIPSCDETKESAILTFTTANPCEAPTNLAVGNITTTTAEISWDGISLSGYEVEYYTATLIDTLLSEGFESGELPQGWTIEGDSQDPTKTWRVGAGDSQTSTGTHSGDYNALITHNNRDEVTYLIMPAFDLGDYDNAQLSFWYVNRNWASDIDEIGVFYRIGTEGEWNELWSTADAHATWTNQTLALTGLADNYQIGFRMIDHWGRGIGLDDIVVFHELAPAGEPMTLTVEEGTTATLTGLADNTTYEARVKANCYEAEYSQPVGFTTPACPAPVATLGTVTATTAELSWTASLCEGYTVKYRELHTLLEEHFDGNDVPIGWTSQHTGDLIVSTNNAGGTPNEAQLINIGDYLCTPAIDLSEISQVQFSFKLYVYLQRPGNPSGAIPQSRLTVEIAISTSSDGGETWNDAWSRVFRNPFTSNSFAFPFSISEMMATSDMGNDNVMFRIKIIDRNGTNAQFNFDDIIIEKAGVEWQTLSVADTAVTLTNLSPNTEYEVKVVPDCDENKESELLIFTTAEMETFTKEIVGYGESNGGYYLIASPVVEPIMPSEENGFLTNAFDLYRFNQNGVNALEWENWKAEENYHYPIENGRGYLYASHDSTTLTFSGTPYSGDGQVTLTKTDGVTFEGWNLVGNPFPTMAFIDDGRPFYTMNGDGSQIVGVVGHSVEVMEAIFVVAEEDGETMTFTTEMPALGASLSLNVMAAEPSETPTHRLHRQAQEPTVIDRAIIRIGEGRQLPKFQLNGNSTKVYIPQGGMDYAVVSSEGTGELPLNFKAEKNGTYTLTVSAENMEFEYLHLIDNLTGADVNLLATSTGSAASYTFTAKTTDYASRFRLVFASSGSSSDAPFAYISNGNIVITTDMGDAQLQIVDVMGRVIASYSGHTRCVPTSGMPAGVYVLRLVGGDSVRTQKMVVE